MAVVPLPFNGAGSHLPSWNSKPLGREWGGEEGHGGGRSDVSPFPFRTWVLNTLSYTLDASLSF